ncbi:TPA: hemin uptake protein HemP [Kluyvera intermedia]|uniref:Hemin uptake protein HemP n=1 Tax=Kluyvera intermedia TaxID=61648 RepID=A0ABX3UEQ9_KLUIN|nr:MULTISPECIES: hemin uptake protein HemP [Enterobacteriaceae]MCL9670557.1 hemin uptake protein HemP [Citrobacter sp. MNAZ 1397]MDU6682470.1 hemin uptake protein HemP [Enterobacteriaceae bacterium]ORJ49988.1 hemin uptake protein HemP [Kluyvera intermedia]HAT2607935.1 hemin uptake protein HemP [Kluyvera intermedia]
MSNKDKPTAPAEKQPASPAVILPEDRRISSKTLLGDAARVVIEHQGQEYLLRQTHAGKLILTK